MFSVITFLTKYFWVVKHIYLQTESYLQNEAVKMGRFAAWHETLESVGKSIRFPCIDLPTSGFLSP